MRAVFDQIVHARLGNASAPGSLRLCDAQLVDYLANMNDQITGRRAGLEFNWNLTPISPLFPPLPTSHFKLEMHMLIDGRGHVNQRVQ